MIIKWDKRYSIILSVEEMIILNIALRCSLNDQNLSEAVKKRMSEMMIEIKGGLYNGRCTKDFNWG